MVRVKHRAFRFKISVSDWTVYFFFIKIQLEFRFRNLKTLTVSGDFAAVYDKAFASCKSFTSLSITFDDVLSRAPTPQSAVDALKTSLKSNKGLKTLKIDGSLVLKEDLSSAVSFKLTEFSVSFKTHAMQLHPNFNLFLKTQADTLECLEVNGWPKLSFALWNQEDQSLKTLLSMTRFKTVSLKNFHFNVSVHAARQIPQNNSVTSLTLKDSNPGNEKKLLNFFLKAFPKLEILKITGFDNEIADLISETSTSLKHLSVESFCLKNVSHEEFFLNLESFICVYQKSKFCLDSVSSRMFERLNVKWSQRK